MNDSNSTARQHVGALPADYLAGIEADIKNARERENDTALRGHIWDRLYHHSGPPIDYLHNEDPVAILKWVLASLPTDDAVHLGRAGFELFRDKLHQAPGHGSDSKTVRALSDLTEFLEFAQDKRVTLEPKTVADVVGKLAAGDDSAPLAKSLYALKTPRGDRLLSAVLRVLAVFTAESPSLARAWRAFLMARKFDDSVLPAFMGYCRAAGGSARDALPLVTQALAARGRPDTLAATLEAFATSTYLDDVPEQKTNVLTVVDFSTLFREVPSTAKASVIDQTFAALGKIGFCPESLPMWRIAAQPKSPDDLFRQLLSEDIKNDAIPIFKSLAWAVGPDARIAFPLVARSIPAPNRGATLAGVLKSFHDGDDFDRKRLGREKRIYQRECLDAGDFCTLFALIPPREKAPAIDETFAELAKMAFPPDKLSAWAEAARTPLTGVLADANDSSLFTKYPVIHALLLPELAAVDPVGYRALLGLYVKSEPRLVFAPRISQRAMEYAPADRFLYTPSPVLKAHIARVWEAARSIRLRLVGPGECASEFSLDPRDVMPEELRPEDEAVVLSVLTRSGVGGGEEAMESAAGLLGLFARRKYEDMKEQPTAVLPENTIAFEQQNSGYLRVGPGHRHPPLRGAHRDATGDETTESPEELLQAVLPPVLRTPPYAPAKTYRPVGDHRIDTAALWTWLRANLNRLVGIQNELPEGVYRSSGGLSIDYQTMA